MKKTYKKTKIRCKETGLIFETLSQAAMAVGCGRSALCNHLAGRFPHVRGLTFERVTESDSSE